MSQLLWPQAGRKDTGLPNLICLCYPALFCAQVNNRLEMGWVSRSGDRTLLSHFFFLPQASWAGTRRQTALWSELQWGGSCLSLGDEENRLDLVRTVESLKDHSHHMTQQSHYCAYTLRKSQFKNTHVTPVFTAALFIVASVWKQPTCPSIDEWIKKLWYIYTMEYHSAIKNEFESILVR